MALTRPFGIRDQIGYFFGDFANGLFFTLSASYLMLFYVDILGISAAAVGTLLLMARVWDAINDPMIGGWIDRQKPHPTRGKFRPWVLYMAAPVIILGILSFSAVPSLIAAPLHVKLIYAYITYIGFGMSYTAINIPYGSLAATMTDVETERATLSMFRSYGAIAAGLSLNILIPLIVFDDNRQPTASGFIILVSVLGTISLLSYILCNRLVTERIIVPHKKGETLNIAKTLQGLGKNRPLLVQMFVGMISICMFLMQSTLAPYLFKDYFQNTDALSINGLLFLFSVVLLSPFVKKLVGIYGKKYLSVLGIFIYTISWSIFLFLPDANIIVYFVIAGTAALGVTLLTLLTWAYIPDCIDYQEYISGVREEGTIYAIYSFSRKLGQAGSGFISAYTLIWVGYVAGKEIQSPETAANIKFYASLIPVILGAVLGVLLAWGYNLDKETLDKVTVELRQRRALEEPKT